MKEEMFNGKWEVKDGNKQIPVKVGDKFCIKHEKTLEIKNMKYELREHPESPRVLLCDSLTIVIMSGVHERRLYVIQIKSGPGGLDETGVWVAEDDEGGEC